MYAEFVREEVIVILAVAFGTFFNEIALEVGEDNSRYECSFISSYFAVLNQTTTSGYVRVRVDDDHASSSENALLRCHRKQCPLHVWRRCGTFCLILTEYIVHATNCCGRPDLRIINILAHVCCVTDPSGLHTHQPTVQVSPRSRHIDYRSHYGDPRTHCRFWGRSHGCAGWTGEEWNNNGGHHVANSHRSSISPRIVHVTPLQSHQPRHSR